jgi:ribosome-associated protein
VPATQHTPDDLALEWPERVDSESLAHNVVCACIHVGPLTIQTLPDRCELLMNDHQDNPPSPASLEIAPGVRIDPARLTFVFTPSTGPGGQNVNRRHTTSTLRVLLTDLPITAGARARLARALGSRLLASGEIAITASKHRTQKANRAASLARLRELVSAAIIPPKPRKKTRPSRGSVERRIQEKKQRGQTKQRRRFRSDDD